MKNLSARNKLIAIIALLCLCCGNLFAASYTANKTAAVAAAYPWEDTTGGNALSLNDNSCSGVINLGFTFVFGGSNFSSVGICSNGALQLGNNTFISGANTALPVANGILLPFWDDLNPQAITNSASQGITYRASGSGTNHRFTVTYLRIPRYCTTGTGCSANKVGFYTFQVTLFEDGRFVYRYGNTSALNSPGRGSGQTSDNDAGANATVGYQVSNTDYINYSVNAVSVFNGDIILWRPTTQQTITRADSTCGTPQQVAVNFSNTVNKASAETIGNYQVTATTGAVVAVISAVLASDNQTVALTLASAAANQIYNVRVNGVQTSGGQTVYDIASYSTGSAAGTGVIGDYFAHGRGGSDTDDILPYFSAINGNAHVIKQDATVDYVVANVGFFPSGSNVHYYSTRWLGYLVPITTAKYCLSVNGDDGVRLYLDGTSILNGWKLQSPTWYTTATPLTLNAGQYYSLQMEYYERATGTNARLWWTPTTAATCSGNPPSGSAAIPTTNLYSCKAPPTPTAFRISHSGSGINCTASPITITAVNTVGAPITSYTGSITLTTNTGHGTWSLKTGSGALAMGTADSGRATYTFAAADNGSVIFNLLDTHPESININVASGSISEDSAYDANLIFKSNGLRFLANGIADAIPAQIAGRPFSAVAIGNPPIGSIQLEAVGTDPTNNKCTALLDNIAQSVNFATECENPTSCLTPVAINGTNIANNNNGSVTTYTALNLNFANGRATLSPINYADAGQLKLFVNTSISIAGQPTAVTGTSNAVVVAPFGFCINPTNNGSNNNPNATDASGTVFTSAGSNFSAILNAVAWDSTDDSNNKGIADTGANLCIGNVVTPSFGRHIAPPNVTLSSALQQPSAGNAGLLSGNTSIATAFTNPANGQATATLSWSEVGIIRLNANSANYLNSGFTISGSRTNVGRFIPHHFAVLNGSTLKNRSDSTSSACNNSSFTYLGEPLALNFSLQAQSTSNSITQNYAGAFAKFQNITAIPTPPPPPPSPLTPNSLNAAAIFTSGARTALTATINGTITPTWTSGTAPISANVVVAKPSGSPASYVATTFGVAPQDSDGVTAVGFNLNTSQSAAASFNHVKIGTTADLLYGRLRVDSTSGPANLALPVPITAEYWNASAFIANTADNNCITLTGASATATAYHGALNSGETTPSGNAAIISGRTMRALEWSPPGAGNEGSVDFTLDISSWSWLQFDWDNNVTTLDTNPTATASSGTYRGSDRVIYWRENKLP